jgi:hypothetical protein
MSLANYRTVPRRVECRIPEVEEAGEAAALALIPGPLSVHEPEHAMARRCKDTGSQGIEPRSRGQQPRVLPLDEPPTGL